MSEHTIQFGIICAKEGEMQAILRYMTVSEEQTVGGIRFTVGSIAGKRTVVALSGIGKVFAAICAEAMILCFAPERIINTGVAGSLQSDLTICDIAVASGAVQYDMDTTACGDPLGMVSGINVIEFPCDARLAEKIEKAAEKEALRARRGVLATGDQFITGEEKKAFLRERFSAIACEMEGAAIAQVCYVNHVPCACIRAISDGGDAMEFTEFLDKASEGFGRIVKRVLEEYDGE